MEGRQARSFGRMEGRRLTMSVRAVRDLHLLTEVGDYRQAAAD